MFDADGWSRGYLTQVRSDSIFVDLDRRLSQSLTCWWCTCCRMWWFCIEFILYHVYSLSLFITLWLFVFDCSNGRVGRALRAKCSSNWKASQRSGVTGCYRIEWVLEPPRKYPYRKCFFFPGCTCLKFPSPEDCLGFFLFMFCAFQQ